MPFRDAEQHLRDILESINNIDTFLGDMRTEHKEKPVTRVVGLSEEGVQFVLRF